MGETTETEADGAATSEGTLVWLSRHGRVALPVVAALGSGLFAVAQSAFLWKLDVQPDELGSTTPTLLGRAVLGLVVSLGLFYAFAVVMSFYAYSLSWVADKVLELMAAWRNASRRRRSIAVFGTAGLGAAAVLAGMAGSSDAARVLGLFALVAAFSPMMGQPTPPGLGWRSWEVSWTAGMLVATVILLIAIAFEAQDSSSQTSALFLAFVLLGLQVVLLLLATALSRRWRRHIEAIEPERRLVLVGVLTIAFSMVTASGYAGVTAMEHAQQVRKGEVPTTMLHALVGWPVQCVDLRWLDDSLPEGVDGPFVRLGAADGTLVLYRPGRGTVRLPAGNVATVPRPAKACEV